MIFRLNIRTRYEEHVKENRPTTDKLPALTKHTVNTCHTYSDMNDTMDILHITPLPLPTKKGTLTNAMEIHYIFKITTTERTRMTRTAQLLT